MGRAGCVEEDPLMEKSADGDAGDAPIAFSTSKIGG
jgi:hypothetical protein